MSKKQAQSKTTTEKTLLTTVQPTGNDTKSQQYLPLIFCSLLGIWYYYMFSVSEGLYQHDETGHMLDMLGFWEHPLDTMINLWSRGGYKILYAISGAMGEKAIVITNILFTCGSAYLTWLVAKKLELKHAWLGFFLFGLQPFILNLSFRCYPEVPTMFFSILLIFFYLRKQYIWAAVTASFLFTLRQEMAVFAVFLGVFFLVKKRWLPFLLLAWAPIALGCVGWYKTGNPMFIVDTLVQGGFADTYQRNGFFYLWLMIPEIVGAIIAILFISGYISVFTGDKESRKQQFRKFHSVFILFTVYFLMHCVFTSKSFGFGRSGGLGRFIIVVSPCIALIALAGLNFYSSIQASVKTKFKLFAVSFLTLVFYLLSLESIMPAVFNSLVVMSAVDKNAFAIMVSAVIIFLLIILKPQNTQLYAALLAGILFLYTIISVKPIALTAEDETMKDAADWFWNSPYAKDKVHAAHSLFTYYGMKNGGDYRHVMGLDSTTLVNAPKGEIFVIDNHYALKSVSPELLNKSKLVVLQQFNIQGAPFAAVILQKQ
ncbi:MAG: hypothetical protein KF746_17365 [Chitinophagaceae bacterium]|nr:hypothetical protein [Chitinophagaceae bacterium]